MDLSLFYAYDEEGNQVELQRPETKSWSDVVQCVNHHKGTNDKVVNLFIGMYLLGIDWDWFESYKDWLKECKKVRAYNDALVPNEEGEYPDPMPEPVMVEQPELLTVEDVRHREYTMFRQAAYGTSAEQFHDVFDEVDHGAAQREAVKNQLKNALAEDPFAKLLPNLDQGSTVF
ncbi:hypothetical protein [Endozoicomonas sp. ONNA2]|uniref:hypothetical protein n=1 Tax=Endozoicomonas sp. ONNA2 TaxID=2828741 RepID=UPI00214734A1|nr:hypothetical protein [Endozoicomonas sp. ONNA2]